MRIATFNIESLDLPPKAHVDIEARIRVLRPVLERLEADILCLQEVNAQRLARHEPRQLAALDEVLAGTRYERYVRSTTSVGGVLADVHNLVTLSRFPVASERRVLHDLVPPLGPLNLGGAGMAHEVRFDRPLLLTDITLLDGRTLSVVNVHLRAPIASPVHGEKSGPFAWRSVSGWGEGFLISALKRDAQALELRLLTEELLRSDPARLVAVAGDFNAPDHSTALILATAPEEDTGSSDLAGSALAVLDRALPADRRFSILHHGRPQMVDHILASRALYAHFRRIEVHNEWLADEAVGFGKGLHSAGSYHAPLVAEFNLAGDAP
jgi:endonuclease/exonuclease/phosphatase family metal-dependent hydrolase